ncbi:MAG: hypothetical protein HOO95_02265 [Gallionella sp.]|nr:hypothetical protein [Gallionella sp.]
MFRYLVISLLFAFSGSVTAQIEIPLDVISLKSMYPNFKELSGDLDNDGVDDFAAIFSEKTSDGRIYYIVVLKGKPSGTYEFVTKSLNVEYEKMAVEIKNKSLYVIRFSNTLAQDLSETYQFKYRDNGYFLIGYEENSYTQDDAKKFRDSINYLTGAEIETEIVGGKTEVIKSRLKEEDRKLLSLEDFSR